MAGTASQIEWYLARGGQHYGPLSESEMQKFIELGSLRPTDLVWRKGFTDWQQASVMLPVTGGEKFSSSVMKANYLPPSGLLLALAAKLGIIYGIVFVALISSLAGFRVLDIKLPTLVEWLLAIVPTTLLGAMAIFALFDPFVKRDNPMTRVAYFALSAMRLLVFSAVVGFIAMIGLLGISRFFHASLNRINLNYLYWDYISLFWMGSGSGAALFSLAALLGWSELIKKVAVANDITPAQTVVEEMAESAGGAIVEKITTRATRGKTSSTTGEDAAPQSPGTAGGDTAGDLFN